MTVEYTPDVSASRFAAFSRLLLRWRGSVWKSVFKELIVWLLAYAIINVTYRVLLNKEQQMKFEDVVAYCRAQSTSIPLIFLLGFYVTQVVQRWWETYLTFIMIDNTALYVATYVKGTDERARMIRRSIVRYAVLVQAMVFRDVSPVVKKRFPNDPAFKAAGLLTEDEMIAMQSVSSSYVKYWLPIHWAFHLICEAREAGIVRTERAVELIQARLLEFRSRLAKQRNMHRVPFPLAYTQVVFIAVRSYLALIMMGQQYVYDERRKELSSPIDIYIPALSILQLLFYLGWVKVAESLLNPYGDDDDDFECNWFIDRNFQVGLTIVDAIGKEPPLEKDMFWHEVAPSILQTNEVLNVPTVRVQNGSVPKPASFFAAFLRSTLTNKNVKSITAEQTVRSQGNGQINLVFEEDLDSKNSNANQNSSNSVNDIVNSEITKC